MVRVGGGGALVVLADKECWKFPQLCDVVRLEHLALVGRPITIKGNPNEALLEVLVCQRDARADGHLGTNDPIATKQSGSVPDVPSDNTRMVSAAAIATLGKMHKHVLGGLEQIVL